MNHNSPLVELNSKEIAGNINDMFKKVFLM